jgi:sugar lactone lactonase YvrE
MTDYSTTLLVDGFAYGEGPRWHDGRLWFTDGPAGAVNVVEDGRIRRVVDVPRASGLGWLSDGTMVVCPMGEAAVVHIAAGRTVRHELGDLAWSTNDMVAFGDRVYVDLYGFTDAAMVGSIALVEPDGEARIVAGELALPNGLVVTPDGSTLLASESDGERVVAFTIDESGGLVDQRVFAALPGRKPDGLCLDAEGAVWVGCYDTGEFLRVRDGGEVLDRIAVSPGWAVAPALGGSDGRTLYLVINETTIEGFLNGESAGRIEVARVDVPRGSPSDL